MVERKLVFDKFEHKIKKDGTPYMSFHNTENEWATAWDKKVYEPLMKSLNRPVSVDWVVNGKFKNIKNFGGICGDLDTQHPAEEIPVYDPSLELAKKVHNVEFHKKPRSNTDKNCELMCAKDLFVALLNVNTKKDITPADIMGQCTYLIELARTDLKMRLEE